MGSGFRSGSDRHNSFGSSSHKTEWDMRVLKTTELPFLLSSSRFTLYHYLLRTRKNVDKLIEILVVESGMACCSKLTAVLPSIESVGGRISESTIDPIKRMHKRSFITRSSSDHK